MVAKQEGVTIDLSGEINISTCARLYLQMKETAANPSWSSININVNNLTQIDTAASQLIYSFMAYLRRTDCKIHIHGNMDNFLASFSKLGMKEIIERLVDDKTEMNHG